MEVRGHPLFLEWFRDVAQTDRRHISALITQLQICGHELGDPWSHPVVTSRYHLHALRRTPPYSPDPPVLRVLYAICTGPEDSDLAILLLGGDKTSLGNQWYPPNVQAAEVRLRSYARTTPTITLQPNHRH